MCVGVGEGGGWRRGERGLRVYAWEVGRAVVKGGEKERKEE